MIRLYLLYNKNGTITETAGAGYGFEFDEKAIEFNHPDKKVMEITEKDYDVIKDNLEYFEIVKGRIKPKTEEEKQIIRENKEEWNRYHTIEGLQEQIDELRRLQRDNKL